MVRNDQFSVLFRVLWVHHLKIARRNLERIITLHFILVHTSYLYVCVWLTLRNGTIPSLAIACRRRGAPVKLWSPAPQVEKKEPKTMTHGDGHANVPITRFPFTASPNLKPSHNIIMKFKGGGLSQFLQFTHFTQKRRKIQSKRRGVLLIPQHCSLNAGAKQHHTGHVWEPELKKAVLLRHIIQFLQQIIQHHHVCFGFFWVKIICRNV